MEHVTPKEATPDENNTFLIEQRDLSYLGVCQLELILVCHIHQEGVNTCRTRADD